MYLDKYLVTPETSVLQTMEKINEGAKGIAYISENGVLKGVITDGDIRRFIIKGGDLSRTIIEIANKNVKSINTLSGSDSKKFMTENNITSVPVINEKKIIIAIDFFYGEKIYKDTNIKTPVVIMAGGKGTRLLPYTQVLPKPLIPIGEKTITEHIISKFEKFGCDVIYLILNYKKELIKSYFSEISLKSDIIFVDEKEFMGTGGGILLVRENIRETFFLTNCDVLIEEDYSTMLHYHKKNNNLLTMVCAIKNIQIPYGTIELDKNGNIFKLKEKPSYSFITNTGLYIIEPEFFKYIPEDKFIHITDIIEVCIANSERVGIYPISEGAWLDMGKLDELDKMKRYMEKMKFI